MSTTAATRSVAGPFHATTTVAYCKIGVPYWVGGTVNDRDRLIARTPDEHRDRGLDVRLRHEVVGIDAGRGRVHLRDLDGDRELVDPTTSS